MAEKSDQLKKLVNSSGYSLQLAVEYKVQTIQTRWEIISREHPWRNLSNATDGFIDLVLGCGNMRLVFECKRPRDGEWVFIISHPKQESIKEFLVCWAYNTSNCKDFIGWDDFDIVPESPESEFCVVRGSGEHTEAMLERLARHVLSSTEALANEEIKLIRRSQDEKLRLLIPIIVTSAELDICKFRLKYISVSNGTLDSSELKTVRWIRFRKSLSVSDEDLSGSTELSKVAEKTERSIFVIRSIHLSDFLRQLDIRNSRFGDPPGLWQGGTKKCTIRTIN